MPSDRIACLEVIATQTVGSGRFGGEEPLGDVDHLLTQRAPSSSRTDGRCLTSNDGLVGLNDVPLARCCRPRC
jgi:hypothetical protein